MGDHLRARHAELLNELTDAERAGLALGLTGPVRALKAQQQPAD